MTRDEAKELVDVNMVYFCDTPEIESNVDEVIDKVYDEFEQERREQAEIRIKSNGVYIERAKVEAERKYKPLLHQYRTAHDSLVKENRRLRQLVEDE